MSLPTSRPGEKEVETEQRADIIAGDEVFFNHPQGHMSGKVLACGEHGATIRCQAGVTHKIKWPHILGLKKRAEQHYNIHESGEDGHIVIDAAGKRRYIAVPNESSANPLVAKAQPGGSAFAGRPGLTKKVITESSGKRNTHWVRTQKEQPKERKRGASEEPVGAKQGYGTQHFETGSKIKFKLGALEGDGTIVGEPGARGAHVKDASGHVHKVEWGQITGRAEGEAPKKEAAPSASTEAAMPADKFNAADFAKQHDQADVSEDSVLSQFPDDTRAKIAAAQERLLSIEQTIDKHKNGDAYLPERQGVHRKIYAEMMSPEKIKAATPAPGEKPTFTMLGGRGGSGKSYLKDKVYDSKSAIVLDADEIKGMLPEYAGWNAHQVHEESSDILDTMMTAARSMGLNIVLDAPMKTGKSAMAKVQDFKEHGYRIEAHYMHLPRQEAAKRAVGRFIGGGENGRYVPPKAILANTENEANFDEVRRHADKWSFHDNNVPQGTPPKLIARSEDKLTKSEQRTRILLWKK